MKRITVTIPQKLEQLGCSEVA